jgi:hypothetical protein
MDKDTSVKVAVRIRPLSAEEHTHEPVLCLDTIAEESQVGLSYYPNVDNFKLTFL